MVDERGGIGDAAVHCHPYQSRHTCVGLRIVDDVFLEVYEPTTEVVQRSYARKGSGREVVFKEVPASWLDDATGADPLEQYQYEEDWKEIKRGATTRLIWQ